MSQGPYHVRNNVLATSLYLGLLALALVGCGSDTEPVRETTAATDTAYAGLLGTIPDTAELRQQVYINDYALVRQLFDIPLPGPGDDDDALVEFYERPPPTGFEGEADDPPVPGFGAISFFGPFNRYRNFTAENLQHLAFDVRSMDQSIVAFALPATLDVVRGRFDPQATDKALESCSECEPPSREEYGGVSYYSWGEDYALQSATEIRAPGLRRDWQRGAYRSPGRVRIPHPWRLRHGGIDRRWPERGRLPGGRGGVPASGRRDVPAGGLHHALER